MAGQDRGGQRGQGGRPGPGRTQQPGQTPGPQRPPRPPSPRQSPPRQPGPRQPPARDGSPRAEAKPFRIAGLPAVAALLARDPDRVERLFFDDRMKPHLGEACARLAALRRPYRLVDGAELEKIAGSAMHGGVVAVAAARPVLPFDVEAAAAWAAAGEPLLLLDGVSNPHNLGAIVRTAAFFGLKRIVLSDHPAQALPSEAAYRVAEGGFEHLELYRASRFASAVKRLGAWYRTVGTALGDHRPLTRLHNGPRPAAVILGNEEQGIAPDTARACAEIATIPGSGAVQSLNVSATAAILVYEMVRGEG